MLIRVLLFLRQIYVQVMIAIVLAILFGLAAPEAARSFKPLGDFFIKLLKIFIGPIIFCTVVLGISQLRELSRIGRLMVKAMVYFEIVSTIALVLGMVVANLAQPGLGLHGAEAGGATADAVARYQATAEKSGFLEYLASIIPDTFASAFTEGEMLPVLFVSILFGSALVVLTDEMTLVHSFLREMQKILFKMLGFIIRLAPLGAFGAMAYTVGAHGGSTLINLVALIALVYVTCIVFVVVVLGAVTTLCGLSLFKIIRLIREEIFLVLGTSSSEVALPRLIDKLERAGCDASVVGVVLPAGYAFNMDGTAIYMSMAVAFIAQATDTPLSLTAQLGILSIMLLTSKGGAGVSGLGFVKLAATLQSVPALPISGLGLLIGVDRFMSEARSITNLIGNSVATFVVAKWEGAYDPAKFEAYLADPSAPREEDAIDGDMPAPTAQPQTSFRGGGT